MYAWYSINACQIMNKGMKEWTPRHWLLLKRESEVKFGMGHMVSGVASDFNVFA